MPDEIAALLSSDDVQIERDIVYGHGGDTELHLDLARPRQADGPLPAILFMHGGGWSKGNRQAGEAGTMLLAKQGFVAATISYRLAPAACFPAQLHDCKTAVRWLRANAATYGIDADHVGAAGHSSGGHLAALLALTPNHPEFEGDGGHANFSSDVQAVSLWSAPSDFLWTGWPMHRQAFLASFLGLPPSDDDSDPDQIPPALAAAARLASPINYVKKGAPPFLLIHGGADNLVPEAQSRLLLAALESKHVPARLLSYPKDGHVLSPLNMLDALQKTFTFFDEILK